MKTKLLKADSEQDLLVAAEILKNGGLVAMPTETVYGLAVNALDGEAVKKVFQAKGRPTDNPLIVHISKLDEIYSLVREFPPEAKALAEKFWPGPLTIILPKSDLVPPEVTTGKDTVGIRMPSHPAAHRLIELAGCPLAAPSANSSGLPSPTTVQHVIDDMNGKIDAIIDGGDCDVGIESTVITLSANPPKLFRPGGVTLEQLEGILGEVEVDSAVLKELAEGVNPESPGLKYKHYSPQAEVFIVKGSLASFRYYIDSYSRQGDMALCFDGEEALVSVPCLSFGDEANINEQAHMLFAQLRRFDDLGAKRVFVRSPSSEGVGLGVYNRLLRSAAFKVIEPPIVYGLTGQTGAGKSTVAKMLCDKGYLVVDGDALARKATQKGSPVLKELADTFGADVLDSKGNLIRSELAKRAFANEANRQKLNSITHPEVTRLAIEQIKCELTSEHKGIVIDAAALLDSKLTDYCTKILVVTAPLEARIERIMERDNITRQSAMLRINAQQSEQYYKERADLIIRNYEPYSLSDELMTL